MSKATFTRTSDLADGFGAGEVRAEDLIAASKASVSPELRAAQMQDVNKDATDELDWAKAAKACDVEADQIEDAAVRGDYVVVVCENPEDGRMFKAVGLASEAGVELSPSAQRRNDKAKAKAKAREDAKSKPKSKSKAKAEK